MQLVKFKVLGSSSRAPIPRLIRNYIQLLEMGVGRMTPMFIQEPFWEMTQYMRDAFYININPKDAITNPVIREKSLLIGDDINEVLKEASEKIKEGR